MGEHPLDAVRRGKRPVTGAQPGTHRIRDMSAEQVRYEIARLRGADVFMLVEYDASTGRQRLVEDVAYDMRGIPNWPCDVNAALSLCLEIAEDRGWRLVIAPGMYMRFDVVDYHDNAPRAVYTLDVAAEPMALDLSRLALMALRGEDGDDD